MLFIFNSFNFFFKNSILPSLRSAKVTSYPNWDKYIEYLPGPPPMSNTVLHFKYFVKKI